MGFFSRGRNAAGSIFRERFAELFLISVALAIVWSLANPYILPEVSRGPECVALPNPPGGNQRSLIAATDDRQQLELRVYPTNTIDTDVGDNAINANSSLELQVVFNNNDDGPVYLYYIEDRTLIRSFDQIDASTNFAGLFLEITPIVNGQATTPREETQGSPITVSPIESFDLNEIFVIQGRRSCKVTVTISNERLRNLGLTQGEFRVVAHYQNRSAGAFPAPPTDATATPIPTLTADQGVWQGHIRSDDVRITIQQ